MKKHTSRCLSTAMILLACESGLLCAAEVTYSGVSGGEWSTGSNWTSGSYPTTSDHAVLNTTANLSIAAPNNIQGIRVGTSGTGRLQIGSQGSLTANSSSSVTSIIGDGSGNHGYVQQEGGIIAINRLEIGSNSATGTYHIHSGSLSITRDSGGHSLFLARNGAGEGTFRISSGSFATRAGVLLGSGSGSSGRFEVIGSHPGSIGIGSSGSLDGVWTQNSGSTLSVRIDKTTQGVTPIFIDDSDNNGVGGDVVFENGALLEVDFTAAFLNGGTFTVMEWEGSVTDNGLQFAPSVDTSIWSFQVDSANKRLTVTAAGNPISRDFVHPGLAHKRSDLDRMRDMVAAGIEPYASTFAALSADSQAQHTYQPSSAAAELATNGGTANNNALRNDGVAAYYNALMWYITGDTRHAEASIRIFTAWSGVKNIAGIPLNAGRHWRLIEAAELIKSTYSGWDPADLQAFKDMLVYPGYSNTTVPSGSDLSIYWRAYQGDPARHGNQGLFAMRCVMAMGVFLDNEIMYDRALRYLQGAPARADDLPYVSGPSIANTQIATYEHFLEYSRSGQEDTIADYGYNEVIHNYIYPNGQGQEFSRDMAHGLAGIGIIATMSEMAWSQGDDLYGYLDNRPLLGLEYFYRYNLSFVNSFPDQPTSWEPTVENGEFIQRRDQSGRWFSLKANPYLAQNVGPEYLLRGSFNDDPVYEMNIAHYRDRMGVPSEDTKWLERGLELLIEDQGFEGEGTPWDHPSWGGLTFRRVSPGDPIQGFSNGNPEFAMNSLPMTIEAENYDFFALDGEGRTYHDSTPSNSGQSYRTTDGVDLSSASEGGFAVTSIEAGEWVTYTISAPVSGNYNIGIRYASTSSGGTIQMDFDGIDGTGAVSIPHGTGGSNGSSDWRDLVVATGVPLNQGVQQLRVNFGGASNAFLLNSITIDQSFDAFATVEAEDYSDQSGIGTQASSEGGLNIQLIQNGDWCAYRNVDFGAGANEFQARVASATSGGNIEIRLGSPTGTLIGTCAVSSTPGWQSYVTATTNISWLSGVHDLYLVFTGGSGYLFNLNWFTFSEGPPPNEAPVATSVSTSLNEDSSKAIALTGTDANGDSLTAAIIGQPANGSLSLSGNTATYTPSSNFNGSDSFTFVMNDGTVDSAPATVSLTVNPVNDVPVAIAQSGTTLEDSATTITLAGTDLDGDTLSYSIVTPPSKGTLSGTGANRTYTPNGNANGSDSFSFVVNDGSVNSAAATVSISVTPVNDVPVANSQSVTTPEDTAKTIILSGTDADGDTLTYAILTQPSKGSLSGSGANRTYTPNANANGSDSFTFRVNDGTSNSTTATVSISVTPVNDDPVFTATSYNGPDADVNTAYSATIAGTASDVDGDSLTYSKQSGPDWLLVSASGLLSGTPLAADSGLNTWTLQVSDGKGGNSTATLEITVHMVQGLVAQWAMNEETGTLVPDATGNGFAASAVDCTWMTGMDGNALDFNGSTSRVNLPVESFASIDNEVSIAMWAYGDSTLPKSNSVFCATDANGGRLLNVHLPWNNSQVYWDAGDGNGYDRINKSATATEYKDAWNHWIFTKNALTGVMNIYLNGELWHTGTGKTKSIGEVASATFGAQITSLSYDGVMDDVLLYNIELNAAEVTEIYDSYTIDLDDFTHQGDIGSVAAAGSASSSDGVFSITGSGADIWGTTDQFYFASQSRNGDAAISARVDDVENINVWSKAGVMFRESLAPNSAQVSVIVRPDKQVSMQWRSIAGGSSSYSGLKGDTTNAKWVKLERSGNVFTGYYSIDGVTWITIASQTISMSAAVETGLAVTSHANGTLCTALISNVKIE